MNYIALLLGYAVIAGGALFILLAVIELVVFHIDRRRPRALPFIYSCAVLAWRNIKKA